MSVRSLVCTTLVAGIWAIATPVLATNYTWSGAVDNDVTKAGNWDDLPNFNESNNQPVGTILVFPNTASTTNVNPEWNDTSDISGIRFDDGAPALTFVGTGYWKMANNDTKGILNNSTSTQTFNTDVGIYSSNRTSSSAQLDAAAGDIVINGTFHASSDDDRTNRYSTIGGAKNVYLNEIVANGDTADVGRIYYNGTGHLILADSGTSYAGDITLQSEGTIRATHSNSFGSSVGGTLVTNTTAGTVELDGTLGDITTGETFTLATRTGTAPHLKNLSGSNEITANLNYSGTTAGNNVSLESDGGLFQISGNFNHASSGSQNLRLVGIGNGLFAGNITASSGNWDIVKEGVGTWELSGENNVDGVYTVSAGTLNLTGTNKGTTYNVASGATLLINGTNDGSTADARVYNIDGTLGGSGLITQTTSPSTTIILGTTGKLAPGNSAGTLTMTLGSGSLDLSAAAAAGDSQSLIFQLGAASDQVVIDESGSLHIGEGILDFGDFAFSTLGGFGQGVYTLFETPDIQGKLGANLVGEVGGLPATLGIDGTNLTLTVVPEPSGFVLVCVGLIGLGQLKRKRQK